MYSRFKTFWDWLTRTHPAIQRPDERRQARLLTAGLLVLAIAGTASEAVFRLFPDSITNYTDQFITILGLLVIWGNYIFSRFTRSYRLTAGIASVTFAATIAAAFLFSSNAVDINFWLFLAFPMLVASFFLSRRAYTVFALLCLGMLLISPLLVRRTTFGEIVFGPFSYLFFMAGALGFLGRNRDLLESDRRVGIEASEERYRSLLEMTYEGICILEGSKILQSNPGFGRIFGYSSEELAGKSIFDLIPDEARRLMGGRDATRPFQAYETTGVHKTGKTLNLEIGFRLQPRSTGMLQTLVVRDITERAVAAKALSESAEMYRALFEHAHDAILLLNLAGAVTATNQQAAYLLGYTPSELVGKTLQGIIAPAELPNFQRHLSSAMTGGLIAPFECIFQQMHGGDVPVEVAIALVNDIEGQPRYMQCVARDITRRKRAEEQNRQNTARAYALARVAARLNAHLDPAVLLQTLCEETAEALHVPAAGVSRIEKTGEIYLAAQTGLPAELCEQFNLLPRSFYHRLTASLGPVVIIPDIQGLPQEPGYEIYNQHHIRTVVGASMQHEGELVGGLHIFTMDKPRRFSEEELSLLKGLADQAALALNHARLYDEAQRRLRHLTALQEIDTAIISSLDLGVTLNFLLGTVTTHLGVDAAAVLLLNPQTRVLEYAAGIGFRTAALQYTRLPLGQGYAGRAAAERCLIHIPNIADHLSDLSRSALLPQEGVVTYFAIPLSAKGQVVGVLEAFHRTMLNPDSEWLQFLEALSKQTAIAIENANLFDNLQRSNQELALAYDDTIEGWSRALDLRDRETEGHTRRVTEMTMRLAQLFGCEGEQLLQFRRGALLHDIGKMGVPDQILHKPGSLTAQEWEVIRQHPTFAHEMLAPISFLKPALDIPYCHHEKWDGSGYPRGLKGEGIPLSARIFAIVDVWDAMSSDRPYRKAMPEEEVNAFLRSQSGLHFEPRIVDAFLTLLERGGEA